MKKHRTENRLSRSIKQKSNNDHLMTLKKILSPWMVARITPHWLNAPGCQVLKQN